MIGLTNRILLNVRRSEVNRVIKRAKGFLERHCFKLPRFAYWSPEEWVGCGVEPTGIVDQQLGWDITDFGSGDFERIGLFLFTIRNGAPPGSKASIGKIYAEKVLIVEPGQVTPTHCHFQKMEDIINRGGGVLDIQVWNSGADGCPEPDSTVNVWCDGRLRSVAGGGVLSIEPGDSVTLPPRLFHKFWGRHGAGTVLVGEVSGVNDDRTDNHFPEGTGRFPSIEEDEPPLHLLIPDYLAYQG